jgi:hypothetical protein
MSSEPSSRQDVRAQDEALEFGLNPSLDAVFKLLSSQRRRHVLHCLREHDAPIELSDVAEEVAAREQGISPAEVSEEEARQIHLVLYHTHVPKLKDANVVRYDQRADTVALSVDAGLLERYADLLGVE